MRPDIERRKRGPGQGRRASESTDTNANEYRLIESGTQGQVVDLDDIRFQRAVKRLHRLGERPLGAFPAELSGRLMIRTEVEQLLAVYSRLDPTMVEAVGADRFAPIPLHEVSP
jgi:hypothetical protein